MSNKVVQPIPYSLRLQGIADHGRSIKDMKTLIQIFLVLFFHVSAHAEETKHNIAIAEALIIAQKALDESPLKDTHVITSISLMTEYIKVEGNFPIYDVHLANRENMTPWVFPVGEGTGKVMLDRIRIYPDKTAKFVKEERNTQPPRRRVIPMKKTIEPSGPPNPPKADG